MSKKRDWAEKDRAEAEWWEAEVVERLHDRAKKAEARVAELEAACTKLQDICQDWTERAQNAEALLDMLDARLQAAERVVEAAQALDDKLGLAMGHQWWDKEWLDLHKALAAWEEVKQC